LLDLLLEHGPCEGVGPRLGHRDAARCAPRPVGARALRQHVSDSKPAR